MCAVRLPPRRIPAIPNASHFRLGPRRPMWAPSWAPHHSFAPPAGPPGRTNRSIPSTSSMRGRHACRQRLGYSAAQYDRVCKAGHVQLRPVAGCRCIGTVPYAAPTATRHPCCCRTGRWTRTRGISTRGTTGSSLCAAWAGARRWGMGLWLRGQGTVGQGRGLGCVLGPRAHLGRDG